MQAEGTPLPEVLWFKNDEPVKIRGGHLGVFNDGTELRISSVRDSDLGAYYTCIARNGEGRIEHVYQLVEAGQLMLNLLLNPYLEYRPVVTPWTSLNPLRSPVQ